ncbi:MAG: response regulator transcription factor [Candidatus Dormibacteraeota bacterium]|nr:response regulator transcription factor [Candidatus Dormibacteraeota bacterium]
MKSIAVAIVHGSPPIGEGLAELLGHQPGLRVVGVHSSLKAMRDAAAGDAAVVLCDLAAARADLEMAAGSVPLLIFNVADEDSTIIDCVQVGASGCMLQDAELEEMVAGIHAVANGVVPSSARVVTSLFRYVASHRDERHPVLALSLTGREEEVLGLVAAGLSNRKIAERLALQPQTVKNHVRRVFEKLDVHSRLELVGALRSRPVRYQYRSDSPLG